jgi:5'-phosphate synthase pdxT subunit
MTDSGPIVGVLAVQGDFAEHEAALRAQGLATRQVRRAADLEGVAGLVLPGGESTTMLKLLELQGLTQPLRELFAGDMPVLATCAGLILLARRVVDPEQPSFGVLDVEVSRNGYGRQIHSGTIPLTGDDLPPGASGVFIRAPRVLAVGEGIEVLARRDEDAVLLRRDNILAACFHPELDPDHFVTKIFTAQVRAASAEYSPR